MHQTARALAELARPLEWSKSLINMLLGAALASRLQPFDVGVFAIGFVAVGPLLWSGLYALNDVTDRHKDRLHHVKKNRPIPSGRVRARHAFGFGWLLIFAAFFVSIFVLRNNLFTLAMFGMVLNQFFYTARPYAWKAKPVIDLVSGSMVNPVLRFYAGYLLFASALDAPFLILTAVIALQFAGYTLYKMSSTSVEKKAGYRNSFAVYSRKSLKRVAYVAIAAGFLSFFAACLVGELPFKYIWLGVLSAAMLPLYWPAVRNPETMDMKKTYRLIYAHLLLFAAGFAVLWSFF